MRKYNDAQGRVGRLPVDQERRMHFRLLELQGADRPLNSAGATLQEDARTKAARMTAIAAP